MGARVTIESDGGIQLAAHLARPPVSAANQGAARNGLVLCHGFPPGPTDAPEAYPQLADRLAADCGWVVLAFSFRGTGETPGDFSLSGWMDDLRAAVAWLGSRPDVAGVWLAGFTTGGALAIVAAGEDPSIRGVASFGGPADFDGWAANPGRFLDHCRSLGVIRSAGFPADVEAWARELREIRPIASIGNIPPRPVLVVHGQDDEMVPLIDARALEDASANLAELRVLAGAGARLRHDPRAIATLIGWLERQ